MAYWNLRRVMENHVDSIMNNANGKLLNTLDSEVDLVERNVCSVRDELKLVVNLLINTLPKIDSENEAYEMVKNAVFDIENQIDNLNDIINSLG